MLTIHDLQYLRFPEYFGRSRHAYLDRMVPRSVAGADVITVPTSYVAGHVAESFGGAATEIVVVPHGVSAGPGALGRRIATVRKRFAWGIDRSSCIRRSRTRTRAIACSSTCCPTSIPTSRWS